MLQGDKLIAPGRKVELNDRLTAYAATLRSRKRTAGNWQAYAAVTGAALAMATNASAGIIYSGIQDVTAGPGASFTFNTNPAQTGKALNLNGMPDLRLSVIQGHQNGSDRWNAIVKINSGSNRVGFLHTSVNNAIKMLASGAQVSSKAGNFVTSHQRIVEKHFSLLSNPESHKFFAGSATGGIGWPAGQIGFAGFSFKTDPGNQNSQTDYGWIRLEYTLGSNGTIASAEAIDWAYRNNGGAIQAGQEEPGGSTTPEPSTGALALLATGAAFVAFLRRRR
jgi:hypothetical protein